MPLDNEALSKLIARISPREDWAYNKHCHNCGVFLYEEDKKNNRCRKCKAFNDFGVGESCPNAPVFRALPFLTSASAIEKLLVWVRSKKDDSKTFEELHLTLTRIVVSWLKSDRDVDSYKSQIVIECVNSLEDYVKRGFKDEEHTSGEEA